MEENKQGEAPVEPSIEELKAQAKAADDYKRDMLRFKETLKAKEAELDAISKQRSEAEKAQLVEKEQFKALYERSEAEKAEAVKRSEAAQQTVQRYIVHRELVEKALTAGLKRDAVSDLKLLDVSGIQVEASGADIRVLGVDDWVSSLKKTRGHWFDTAAPVDFKDKAKPSVVTSEDSPEALEELKKKDPEAYRKKYAEMLKGRKV
jgi:hypothetical protein